MNDPARQEDDMGGDILIVSHGHFSRCLLARWLGLPLEKGQLFSLDPGGVSQLLMRQLAVLTSTGRFVLCNTIMTSNTPQSGP